MPPKEILHFEVRSTQRCGLLLINKSEQEATHDSTSPPPSAQLQLRRVSDHTFCQVWDTRSVTSCISCWTPKHIVWIVAKTDVKYLCCVYNFGTLTQPVKPETKLAFLQNTHLERNSVVTSCVQTAVSVQQSKGVCEHRARFVLRGTFLVLCRFFLLLTLLWLQGYRFSASIQVPHNVFRIPKRVPPMKHTPCPVEDSVPRES